VEALRVAGGAPVARGPGDHPDAHPEGLAGGHGGHGRRVPPGLAAGQRRRAPGEVHVVVGPHPGAARRGRRQGGAPGAGVRDLAEHARATRVAERVGLTLVVEG